MNVVVASHCDFSGNSAFHALAVAKELHARGLSAVICLPANPETVEYVGEPPFPVLTYDEALAGSLPFPDGRGADLIHAFTPREHVRSFTEALSRAHSCPYVVHLEDNEAVVLADDLAAQPAGSGRPVPLAALDTLAVAAFRSHPVRASRFLHGAAGMTAVIDTLLELKPEGMPGVVFWPGFEAGMLESRPRERLRDELGLAPDELVLVYTGNIHNSNVGEVRSLYIAVGLLRRAGLPVRLVKAGWNQVDMAWAGECVDDGGVLDIGFVGRERVAELLALADVLVQPGGPSPFNDYRLPSKVPEFLASGKPVVLPATNIGRHLVDGEEALLLRRGDAAEIFEKVRLLADDTGLRARLGERGRAFALRELTWERNVGPVVELYEQVVNGPAPAVVAATPPPEAAPPVKLVAFYLPQFHAIPENDAWWGEGFTEWTNVRSGTPHFAGHEQPQLPGPLGFYDLDDPEVLVRQAELARSYGIYGFCFYHYWFDGRRLLERPVDRMLASGEPDLPFCLCWANESWTRSWTGNETDVLMRQEYPPGWDERFIRDLLPAFGDPRYLTVDGAPLLLVYRAGLVPVVERAVERWRTIAADELGVPLHLAAVQSFGLDDPRPLGFDAAVEFPPHTERFLLDHDRVPGVAPGFRGYFEDYLAVRDHQLARPLPDYRWYRGTMPSWDNTARRGPDAHILVRSSPEAYATWLRKLVLQTLCRSPVDEPLVFLNAWNEWAEGTHLEPDELRGHAWLEATQSALRDGVRQFYASEGFALGASQVADHLRDVLGSTAHAATLTSAWLTGAELESVGERYRGYEAPRVGYATVRDYVDSWEHLRPLATAQSDLKDVQRPWALKTILGSVPRPGRVLEIGAGEPFVADLLSRLGYEVWVVDPYDGSGNGPVEFERYRRECPGVRFVRDVFSDRLDEIEAGAFDCVYSISVLEHVDREGIDAIARGIRRALKPGGVSVHAVDHVHLGAGHDEHLGALRHLAGRLEVPSAELDAALSALSRDPETYYLSAESHNRWRGETPYDEFPMRACVSIQLVVR